MIRPSRMIVERLIRHFRAKEYSDACNKDRSTFFKRSTFKPGVGVGVGQSPAIGSELPGGGWR